MQDWLLPPAKWDSKWSHLPEIPKNHQDPATGTEQTQSDHKKIVSIVIV